MSDATDLEFRAVLEQHPSYKLNKEGSRIRCGGCAAVLEIGSPPNPNAAFVKHLMVGFADLSQELGSWRRKSAALGADLTGLTGLNLAVATAKEGDLVDGTFHNTFLGLFTIKGVVTPSINAGGLLVGGHLINEGHLPASGLRELTVIRAKGEHSRVLTPDVLEMKP